MYELDLRALEWSNFERKYASWKSMSYFIFGGNSKVCPIGKYSSSKCACDTANDHEVGLYPLKLKNMLYL